MRKSILTLTGPLLAASILALSVSSAFSYGGRDRGEASASKAESAVTIDGQPGFIDRSPLPGGVDPEAIRRAQEEAIRQLRELVRQIKEQERD